MKLRRSWNERFKAWRSSKLLWGVVCLLCLLLIYSGWSVFESYRIQAIIGDWKKRGVFLSESTKSPEWLVRLGPRTEAVVRSVLSFRDIDQIRVEAKDTSRLGEEILFTTDDIRKLENFPALRSLIIQNYAVTDDDLSHISRVYSLKNLMLTCSDVSDSGISQLRKLKYLNRLSLEGTYQFSTKGLEQLATLPELSELSLTGFPVSREGIIHLCKMKNLRVLAIDGSQLTEEDLKQLDQMEKLSRLVVLNTKLTDQSLTRVRGRLFDRRIRLIPVK